MEHDVWFDGSRGKCGTEMCWSLWDTMKQRAEVGGGDKSQRGV